MESLTQHFLYQFWKRRVDTPHVRKVSEQRKNYSCNRVLLCLPPCSVWGRLETQFTLQGFWVLGFGFFDVVIVSFVKHIQKLRQTQKFRASPQQWLTRGQSSFLVTLHPPPAPSWILSKLILDTVSFRLSFLPCTSPSEKGSLKSTAVVLWLHLKNWSFLTVLKYPAFGFPQLSRTFFFLHFVWDFRS